MCGVAPVRPGNLLANAADLSGLEGCEVSPEWQAIRAADLDAAERADWGFGRWLRHLLSGS